MDPSTRVGPFINQVLYRGDEECRGNEEIKRLFKVTGCVLGLYWDIFDDDFFVEDVHANSVVTRASIKIFRDRYNLQLSLFGSVIVMSTKACDSNTLAKDQTKYSNNTLTCQFKFVVPAD